MLVELKRYNSIGDTFGVAAFIQIVFQDVCIREQAARDLIFIRQDVRVNFDVAESFFAYIGWLDVSDGVMSATERFRAMPHKDSLTEEMCRDCIVRILSDGVIDPEAVIYDVTSERYMLRRFAFPVSASIFRNTLLQFKAIVEVSDGFLVATEFEENFADAVRRRSRKMSLEKLMKIQEAESEQGAAGEVFVLNYEKKRLGDLVAAGGVKRISDVDVCAGYDIVSRRSASSQCADRFIEVKTYRGSPHFYWTANEISKARLFGDQYVLALVDYDKIGQNGYEPTFISNPAIEVLENKGWIYTPTTYSVVPMGEGNGESD